MIALLFTFNVSAQPEIEMVFVEGGKFMMGSNEGEEFNKPAHEVISWKDIQKFIKKLNLDTGKKYRLPTEAEWEFAARGGIKSKGFTFSGGNNIAEVAWYFENSDSTIHKVGLKQPNELGIYDMTGNVWESCSDRAQYYLNDKRGDKFRMLRGGSWKSAEDISFPWYRDYDNIKVGRPSSGFRLAMDN